MKSVLVLTVIALSVVMGPLQARAQATAPSVRSVEEKVVKAWPLPLDAMRLTGGPLKAAQDADVTFLLSLDPDRALSALRTDAGLDAKADPLGGWDNAGRRSLTGHIAGHLLSAVSLMYAATGDTQFKKRADYMVSELAAIQEKQGDGYIGAQHDARGTPGRDIYKQISKGVVHPEGEEGLNGLWSPWYVEHKLFAGLRDAYRHTGNKTALDVETKFAAWVEQTLVGLNDEQIQKMLSAEFGGMNEVLADLYADSGDKRWLDLSYKFEHRALAEPMAQGKEILGGKHGNHNIPKMVGSAARYNYVGKAEDLAAADFFWNSVVHHHTFATGGDSGAADGEFFPQPDKLAAMIEHAPAAVTNESCNVYNMLKLTRRLFSFEPDARYADFLERALFNHALAQINPANGLMAYHVSVGQGARLDYQGNSRSVNTAFTCCVGTGMENPALYGDGIYYQAGDKLWVNLYAPNTAEWSEKGATIKMDSDLPEGDTARLTLTLKAPESFTLALRRPSWTTPAFKIMIDGTPFAIPAAKQPGDSSSAVSAALLPSSYVEVTRTWKTGDTIELTIPKNLRLEPTPDDPNLVAIMWGPLVLAEDMGAPGPQRPGRQRGAATPANNPVIVTSSQLVSDWLKPVAGEPGQFHTDGVGRIATSPSDVTELNFVPIYRVHEHTYSVYMNLFTPQEWTQRAAGTP
jgi:DUF1680 family protein